MPEVASDEQLAELRRLETAATAGPWRAVAHDSHDYVRSEPLWEIHAPSADPQYSHTLVVATAATDYGYEGGIDDGADAELIAAARNSLPSLLARVEQAETDKARANKVAVEALKDVGLLMARIDGIADELDGLGPFPGDDDYAKGVRAGMSRAAAHIRQPRRPGGQP